MFYDEEVVVTIQVVNPEEYETLGISRQEIECLKPCHEYVVLAEKGFTLLSDLPTLPKTPFETIEVIQKTEDEIKFEISDYYDFGTNRPQKFDSYTYSL